MLRETGCCGKENNTQAFFLQIPNSLNKISIHGWFLWSDVFFQSMMFISGNASSAVTGLIEA